MALSWVFNPFTGNLDAVDGTGSTASNSFETINCPAGTDPVADSATDTLNLTSADTSVTITGTAGTDTIDFSVSAASIGAANQTLSNLTAPTAVSEDLIGDTGTTWTIQTQDEVTGVTQDLTIRTGDSGDDSSGNITITAINGGGGGVHGDVTIDGEAIIINNQGGNIDLQSGGSSRLNVGGGSSVTVSGVNRFIPGADGTIELGEDNARWEELHTRRAKVYSATSGSAGVVWDITTVNPTTPSGGSIDLALHTFNEAVDVGLYTETSTTGRSGNLFIETGLNQDTATSDSGSLDLLTGNLEDAGNNGNSGYLNRTTGSVAGAGNSGNINDNTGNVTVGESGGISRASGSATGAGISGNIIDATGMTEDGDSGSILYATGEVTGVGASGPITLQTGPTNTGISGDINILTGPPTDQSSGSINIKTADVATVSFSGNVDIRAGTAADGDESAGQVILRGYSVNIGSPSIGPNDIYARLVQTTDNTPTTIFSLPTDSDALYQVKARINGRQSAGAAGNVNDAGFYEVSRTFKNDAGTVTATSALVKTVIFEDNANWDVDLDTDGSSIIFQVTGDTDNTVEWRVVADIVKNL